MHTTAVAVSPLCAGQFALHFSACSFCLVLAFGCLFSVAVACSGRDVRAHALQQRTAQVTAPLNAVSLLA